MTNLIPPSDTNTVSVTFSVRTPAEPVMPNKEQIESFITEKQKKSTSAHISEPPTDVTEQVKSVNGKNLYERENLYEEVWNNPVTKVAEKYGVSDVMMLDCKDVLSCYCYSTMPYADAHWQEV